LLHHLATRNNKLVAPSGATTKGEQYGF
jgi:hypothetical protein